MEQDRRWHILGVSEHTKEKEEENKWVITTEEVFIGAAPGVSLRSTSDCIRKAVVHGVTPKTSPREVLRIADRYDLIGVYLKENSVLDRCSMWQINSIDLELSESILCLRKGSICRAVNCHIYFTLNLDGYFDRSKRKIWMYNVRELLRVCRKRSIIVSCSKDISREQIEEILRPFGIKRKTVQVFLFSNPQRMLIREALRKYAHMGFISAVEPVEGPLKRMLYECTTKERNIK